MYSRTYLVLFIVDGYELLGVPVEHVWVRALEHHLGLDSLCRDPGFAHFHILAIDAVLADFDHTEIDGGRKTRIKGRRIG